MSQLFRFPGAARRDPAVERWLHAHPGPLGAIAQRWFDVMRGCGDDVRELLHDGHPTACVDDAAFADVNAFTRHVNVAFFRGAEIDDPDHLLEGSGRFMRHVKLEPGREVDAVALTTLIEVAYRDMVGAALKRKSRAAVGSVLRGAPLGAIKRLAVAVSGMPDGPRPRNRSCRSVPRPAYLSLSSCSSMPPTNLRIVLRSPLSLVSLCVSLAMKASYFFWMSSCCALVR